MVEPIFDYQFRIIIIGNSTVGKSSLLKYFTDGRFAEVNLFLDTPTLLSLVFKPKNAFMLILSKLKPSSDVHTKGNLFS